jgi:aspartate/methionine/tyrosine aminotransferase
MRPVFSKRVRQLATVNIITERCQSLRAAGVLLLDLTRTNPTEAGLFNDNAWLASLATEGGARYQPAPFGLLSARTAVAQMYAAKGLAVDPRQVALCGSTSEAYTWIFKLLSDTGEQILVPRPSYPLLEHLATLADVRLAHYMIDYDGAYFIDTDSVRRSVTPQTKALVLISPNNPTGSFTRLSELATMASLGVPLISDEVFSDYCLLPSPPELASALVAESSLVFALGGLSKSFAWPQLKLAWIVVGGDKELREQALARLELIADSFLSPNTPVQVALPRLIDFGAQRHAKVKQRLLQNAATLTRLTKHSPVDSWEVQGGWSAVLRLPLTVTEDWALILLEQQRVLVQPGWFYDFTDDRIVVVSLLTKEDEFSEGIERLVHRASS